MIVKINIELTDNTCKISDLENLGLTQDKLENFYINAFKTLLDGVIDPRMEHSITVCAEDN